MAPRAAGQSGAQLPAGTSGLARWWRTTSSQVLGITRGSIIQLFYRTVVDLSSNLLLPSFCSQLLRDVEGALTMKRSSRLS